MFVFLEFLKELERYGIQERRRREKNGVFEDFSMEMDVFYQNFRRLRRANS